MLENERKAQVVLEISLRLHSTVFDGTDMNGKRMALAGITFEGTILYLR